MVIVETGLLDQRGEVGDFPNVVGTAGASVLALLAHRHRCRVPVAQLRSQLPKVATLEPAFHHRIVLVDFDLPGLTEVGDPYA